MAQNKFDVPVVDDDDPIDGQLSKATFSKFRKTAREVNDEACSKSVTASEPPKDDKDLSNITNKESSVQIPGTSKQAPNYAPAATIRSVVVSGRQKGNPLLRFLRNVPWEWGDISADYQISLCCCVLFLSAKYHKLHAEYIHQRFKKVAKSHASQILLFLLDVEEPKDVLREINSMCFLTGCWTLLVCWSYEECAEYIEALKIYENKPAEFLMANEKTTRNEKPDDRTILIDLLTTIRSVTKTDAENMIEAFGSLKNIVEATVEQLALCRGIGMLKAKRIYDAFSQSFSNLRSNNETGDLAKDIGIDDFEAADDY